MTPLAADLLLLFRRDLRCLIREVELFPDDATLWRTVPGIANSAGNVALHVAGNLQHFVGAVLGATGYVRQREREFAQREGTRASVAGELEASLVAVEAGMAAMTEAALTASFPVPIGGHRMSTGRFLLHLEAHLAFHLGQAGYLRRALTGDATSAGGMAIQDLAEA
ncbi:DinB family protein [Geothrix fuzhouensis]|uniref:DinB family protein n=1 Tax=Geothrix fuzhouensis TaxID=2966451 RepID=UPI0021473584|nr:DinB family protein [Geothrix fuzhouensis]